MSAPLTFYLPNHAETHARLLVTGATGMLGRTLVPVLEAHGFDVWTTARGGDISLAADLTEREDVGRLVAAVRPGIIINLAAATDVDLCERDPQSAFRQNALVVEQLAWACAHAVIPMRLIQISTDHVYDGDGTHAEHDVTIRNHYAMSKLAGEYAALRHGHTTVLRVNFVGRSAHPLRASFSDWVVTSLRSGIPIEVFDDVWFSPLRMQTMARLIADVAARPVPGVFNLGATGAVSKAVMARTLAAALKLDTQGMRNAQLADQLGRAPRPRGMAMDSSRFAQAFGSDLPTIHSEIKALAEDYSIEVRP